MNAVTFSLICASWLTIGAALIRIDAREHRLPNRIVAALMLITSTLLVTDAVIESSWNSLIRSIVATVITVAFYGVIAAVSRGGIGLGDVKLAAPIGMLAGYLSWAHLVLAVTIASVLGALYGVGLLLFHRASKTSDFAYGPFLMIGTWSALLAYAFTF